MSGGELPEGWVWAKLGDHIEFKYGKSLPDRDRDGGQFPVFASSGHVGNHSVALTSGPSIVVGRKGSTGTVYFCPGPVFPIDTTYFIDHFGPFEARYLEMWLSIAGLGEMNRSSAIPGLNRNDAYDLDIAIPPLPEQRRIVAKLDELRARSRKAREALDEVPALLEKLKQSVLAAAFRGDLTANWRATHPDVEPASVLLQRIRRERKRRWEEANPRKKYVEPEPVDVEGLPELPAGWGWARMEELPPPDAPIVYGIIQPGPHIPDGVPFVRPADIRDNQIQISDLPRTSKEIAEDYRRAALEPNDVVFSIVGTIGKWIIAGEQLKGANITQSSVRLRPAWSFSPWFYIYTLESPILESQIRSLLFGNAVQRLNVDHVRKLIVPIPPLAEWRVLEAKISAALGKLGATSSVSAAIHLAIGSLDQSLLQKAFQGTLVPQDPQDETAEKLLARIKLLQSGKKR